MRKSKKVLSVILSLSMAFSMSLIQPNYQVKADNSYSVLDANDNGKEEGTEVTPIDISSGNVQIDWSNVKDSYEFVGKRIIGIFQTPATDGYRDKEWRNLCTAFY